MCFGYPIFRVIGKVIVGWDFTDRKQAILGAYRVADKGFNRLHMGNIDNSGHYVTCHHRIKPPLVHANKFAAARAETEPHRNWYWPDAAGSGCPTSADRPLSMDGDRQNAPPRRAQ